MGLASLSVVSFFCLIGCSPQGGDSAPSQQNLPPIAKPGDGPIYGFILGEAWEPYSVKATLVRSGLRQYIRVEASNRPDDRDCNVPWSDGVGLQVNIPNQVGTWVIGDDPFAKYPNVFFMDGRKSTLDPRRSFVATSGKIEVADIGPEEILLRVHAAYPPQSYGLTQVEGWLAVPLCVSK